MGYGAVLISSDYTAIEGVVIACIAGEQWRIDAYRRGADLYLESASRITRIPVAEALAYREKHKKHHPMRHNPGKYCELALGFGGWIGALRGFGWEGNDDEAKRIILPWRDASPAIVHMWGGQSVRDPETGRRIPHLYGLEGAAIAAVQSPGLPQFAMRLDGTWTGVTYVVDPALDILTCWLPSGRPLTYHRPRLAPSEDAWRGLALSFEGWNTNAKKGRPGWQRMALYGGLLAENVVQATARDLLMPAMQRLEAAGYPVVLSTYDEVVCERAEGGCVEELERILCERPPWAADWPINAANGWRARTYRKA